MKTLYRSRTNKVIAGIFGGLGEIYHVDANILRLLYALVGVFTGFIPALVLYIVAWALIPEESVVRVS